MKAPELASALGMAWREMRRDVFALCVFVKALKVGSAVMTAPELAEAARQAADELDKELGL